MPAGSGAEWRTSYQAVSGADVKGIEELRWQTQALVRGEPIQPKYFAHQIAFNLIPPYRPLRTRRLHG